MSRDISDSGGDMQIPSSENLTCSSYYREHIYDSEAGK